MDMVIDPPVAAAEGGASEASSNNNGGGEEQRKKKKTPVTEILKLELQLLRVPVEHLKKSLRSAQRTAEKDLSAVLADISSVTTSPTVVVVPPVSSLTSLVCQLHGIKRKLEESSSAEAVQVQCSDRTLGGVCAPSPLRVQQQLEQHQVEQSHS